MQLSFDAADRLVELVQARHGPVPAEDAARALYALRHVPTGLARSLLDDVVTRRRAPRLARRERRARRAAGCRRRARGGDLRRRRPGDDRSLARQRRRSARSAPSACAALELAERFETLVNPTATAARADRGPDRDRPRARCAGAPAVELAVRRFLEFAGDAVLVAHNARFDVGFLDREVERLTGRRIAAPVVDTVWLARRLLDGRAPPRRARLARALLRHRARGPATARSRTPRRPPRSCSRCSGSRRSAARRRSSDVVELAAPRARRLAGKRFLAAGAPARPGVYLFRDRNDQVLYVGRARDLRARLRSYFRTERQRPAVEAALGAVERIEWRVLGSELEAALEELRLLRELRPPANARSVRPDRHVYLRRRGSGWCVTEAPGPYGPLKSRRLAGAAATRASGTGRASPPRRCRRSAPSCGGSRPTSASRTRRRLRDRITALEEVVAALAELERLRALELCLLVPAAEDGLPARVLRHRRPRRRGPDARSPGGARPGRGRGGSRRRRPGRGLARTRPTPTSCS